MFETTELPFAESIGTSLDLENDQIKNYGRMICLFRSMNKMVHVSTRLLTFGITPFIITALQITTNLICIKSDDYSREDTENFTFTMTHSDVMTIRNVKMKKVTRLSMMVYKRSKRYTIKL